jgi:hypothetical protein
MADLSGFNASKVPESEFEAIPAGEYRAVIIDSNKKPTKAGNGHLLEVKLQILDGQYKNRTLFDRFNLWNASQQAKDIAAQQFAKVCKAVNVLEPKDSSELHMKPLMIKVAVSEYDGKDRNEVKNYKAAVTSQQPQLVIASAGEKKAPAGWS